MLPRISLRAELRVFSSRLHGKNYSVAATRKVWDSADEAVKDVKSGDVILSGGGSRIS